MADLYQVTEWNEYFEGAKSKTYNNKTTCQMPTKHGLGYRRLIRHKDGPAMFGAWCAMIQLLSRQQKPREGYLTDTGSPDGIPMDSEDLELLCDIPSKIFDRMLQVCVNEKVAWLRNHTDTTRIPQGDSNLDLDLDLDSNLNSSKKPLAPKQKTKVIKDKASYEEFVFLTDNEYSKLIEKFGSEFQAKAAIETLNNYKASSGKKYKSDYHALIGWVFDKLSKGNHRSAPVQNLSRLPTQEEMEAQDDVTYDENGEPVLPF